MEQCSLLITSLTTTLSVVDKKKQEKVKQKLRFFFSYHVTNTVSIHVVHLHEMLLLSFIISLAL